MSMIIRTATKAAGGITADEKRRMDEHAKVWISRAMRTDPIEPDKIIPAIKALYAAAGLKEPRVVIAPSPLVMAFAYGAAAAIWHCRYKPVGAATRAATRAATYDATLDATYDATEAATRDATHDATHDATYAATEAATHGATYDATDAATRDATRVATEAAIDDATHDATHDATYAATHDAIGDAIDAATDAATRVATYDATDAATCAATDAATSAAIEAEIEAATQAATRDATEAATYAVTYDATYAAIEAAIDGAAACFNLAGKPGIQNAVRWSYAYQGGNMWASYECYLTAMRDIIGLRLPTHKKYAAWEQCAIHGGFRVLHPEFCIVSDFPEVLKVDEQNRPHCETGPSHRWRDGWSLYHWHGVKVPAHWIEQRETLDPNEVIKADNVEQRAAGAAIVGWPKMLSVLKSNLIDDSGSSDIGQLIELTLPGLDEPGLFLKATCPRNGIIVEGVPRVSDIDGLPINTALAAQAWRIGDPQSEYQHPPKRT